MYSIDGLCPTGHVLGGYGFIIHLAPEFRDAVATSAIDQVKADRVINTFGPEWLVKCGFSHYFDPENCDFERREYAIPSDETRLSQMIRITWGEWGPEHITVPGNSCGLDIERSSFSCLFEGGCSLLPHNVDHWGQVNLLLIIFTWFANSVMLMRGE